MATQAEMRSVGLNLQVLPAVGSTCTERLARRWPPAAAATTVSLFLAQPIFLPAILAHSRRQLAICVSPIACD
jgi:hypothetical protein